MLHRIRKQRSPTYSTGFPKGDEHQLRCETKCSFTQYCWGSGARSTFSFTFKDSLSKGCGTSSWTHCLFFLPKDPSQCMYRGCLKGWAQSGITTISTLLLYISRRMLYTYIEKLKFIASHSCWKRVPISAEIWNSDELDLNCWNPVAFFQIQVRFKS